LSALVGPVLEASHVGRGIVAAIRELNEEVDVSDRGAYLRVLVPERCIVTRAVIERILGRRFRLPSDLELVMPSFAGCFSVSEEDALWEAHVR
jgi:toluene monooxygenase system protein D